MRVPLLDLQAQYVTIKDEIMAGVCEVLESQRCIGGSKVAELEDKIAALSDARYAVGVSGGTDAIQAAVLCAKLPYLDRWSEARRRNADYYDRKFAGAAVSEAFFLEFDRDVCKTGSLDKSIEVKKILSART